jgi:hypothetical protein
LHGIFYKKVSDAKNIKCLRFLTDCGICVDGIDLSKKRQKVFQIIESPAKSIDRTSGKGYLDDIRKLREDKKKLVAQLDERESKVFSIKRSNTLHPCDGCLFSNKYCNVAITVFTSFHYSVLNTIVSFQMPFAVELTLWYHFLQIYAT